MKVVNRRAFYDYEVLEKFSAGVKLTGPEVKSAKLGHISLSGSFVKITGSEAYLVNVQISPYPFASLENYDPARTRKLLLHKKETIFLKTKTITEKLTIIPLSCYTSKGLVKLELALARIKKKWNKRRAIKERELRREEERMSA